MCVNGDNSFGNMLGNEQWDLYCFCIIHAAYIFKYNSSAALSAAEKTEVMSTCVSTAVATHDHLSWKADFRPGFRDIEADTFALFHLWFFYFQLFYSVPFGETADIHVFLLFICIIFGVRHINAFVLYRVRIFRYMPCTFALAIKRARVICRVRSFLPSIHALVSSVFGLLVVD